MGTKQNSTPTIYNVAMATGAHEYSQALPKGAKKVIIQLRPFTADLWLYYVTAGSNPPAQYITIPAGTSKALEGVWLDSVTLFFQSPVASQTAEIEVWN